MIEDYDIFVIGSVGAIAPEILRFYKLRDSLTLKLSLGYILISIVFVLLGGFMTYILKPSSYYAAFYSGISTPFIINSIAKETQDSQEVSDENDTEVEVETASINKEQKKRKEKGINITILNLKSNQQQEKDRLKKNTNTSNKLNLKKFFRAL